VGELPNRYSHVIFSFVGGAKLFFNDMRQFGYLRVVNYQELKEVKAQYGIEPLTDDFSWKTLLLILQKRKTALKNVLLDQKVIAGLGNIYVDEACFAANIRPWRRADRISREEVKKLERAIRRILKLAIENRGTTFGDYRDGLGGEGNFVKKLKVYGRVGKLCKRCKKVDIKKVRVGGRGTSYCPVCQVR
jgi:formamidopyrimidine-DNA glycosylase